MLHLRHNNVTIDQVWEIPNESGRKVRLQVKVSGVPDDSDEAKRILAVVNDAVNGVYGGRGE